MSNIKVNIIGAGLTGLSAAIELSREGVQTRLISVQCSERAQSNLAEGGINACMNVMGEDDHVYEHFEETLRGGCMLADPNMAAGLCMGAPQIIRELIRYGVPFHREKGKLVQRSFGGQKKKRTTFVKSSTGKMITAAMIDAVRQYECEGLVERLPHHEFVRLDIRQQVCRGVFVHDRFGGDDLFLAGPVVMAVGGMNGLFAGRTTGSTANTGLAAAVLFAQGVEMANLEMIQYHPTTVQIAGKRMLISEAARGEGGRLFYYGGKEPDESAPRVYFMEEKYGVRGNLMPRDVVSREIDACGRQVYLDLTELSEETWEKKLSDLREEIIHYLAIDPKVKPVPISPGIHFFMGGIRIDEHHRTNIRGLYAAGECACGYHGANRLGGNSLLGAVYGGKAAAAAVREEVDNMEITGKTDLLTGERGDASKEVDVQIQTGDEVSAREVSSILLHCLPIVRSEKELERGLMELGNAEADCRVLLAEAFLMSALARKESRGAHTIAEYPDTLDDFRMTTVASCRDDKVQVRFEKIPSLREDIRAKLYEDDKRGVG